MNSILLGICGAEAVVLTGVVFVLVRLYLRVQALGSRADGAVAQMQDWVLEAEQLSAALVDQLHERPRQATSAATADGDGVVLRFADVAERAGEKPAERVPADRPTIVPATDRSADQRLAREKRMDPAGLALQRLLGRDSGIA
jgi:hypothetical protein